MKLYYAPNTCSLASHIVLRELGLPFDLVKVDIRAKRTSDGRDYLSINPKGYVAALELDGGDVVTEGAAIVQYLADLRPERGLAPAAGTMARVRLQEWLAFITSELHGGMGPLFNPSLPDDARVLFREKLSRRFDYLQGILAVQDYVMGDTFSVADAYLFTVLGWCDYVGIDIARWPALPVFVARVGDRPTVQAALRAEAGEEAVEVV